MKTLTKLLIGLALISSVGYASYYIPPLGVLTSMINDLAVTTGKINTSAVTTAKIADLNVTTAKIADSNVTTAKIADHNVTNVKLGTANKGISSSSGVFSTAATGFTDVGITASITTTGRPVWVGLMSDELGSAASVKITKSSATALTLSVRLTRGAAPLGVYDAGVAQTTAGLLTLSTPASSYFYIDFPGPGSYTYGIQVHADPTNGGSVFVSNAVLFAYEL